MVKNALKIYFKSFKYAWIPLASLVLFLGIGFLVCFIGSRGSILDLGNEVKQIQSNINVNYSDMVTYVYDSIVKLFSSGVKYALSTLFRTNYIYETIVKFIETTNQVEASYKEQLEQLVLNAVNNYDVYVIIFFVCFIIGIVLGYMIPGILINRKYINRKLSRTILITVLTFIYNLGVVSLISVLLIYLGGYGALLSIVVLAIYILFTFFMAYLGQRKEGSKFSDVYTLKNTLSLVLSDVIILAIAISAVIALFFIPIKTIGFVLSYPIIIITADVLKIVAEAYVKKYYEENA